MNNNILLSVVIPTYNRYAYLIDCIKVTASIKTEKMEIVVQDNTEDNSEIVSVIDSLNDNRIKYYHQKKHISVVKNSDMAVSHASGKYVCMIGDDDTICESMLKAAEFCDANNIDACMSLIPGFNWPDMTFVGKRESQFFVLQKATGEVTEIDSVDLLHNAIINADGLPRFLPRVYHGIVSKECLERVYSKCGSYFPGPSPDMANATAVSLESKKTVIIHDYLMVSGYGKKSARGEGNRKEHFGKISEKPWLPADTEKKWNSEIPKVFSAETIFAQSLLESLHRMGRDDLTHDYNYGCLYAMFFAHHPAARKYMIWFLGKRPHRLLWFVKGIRTRLYVRNRILSREREVNFLEEDSICSLSEAQERINELRREINVPEYYWK